MNSTSKSMLAKLLAKENITVNHGNYSTAFFDVEKRVLGLPLWKDMDKNVYDLMIGHEVGHALETPSDGWHNSTFDIPGCPRAFVNIIEDIRIEKLIQRRYPGLVLSFKRGYAELKSQDFFGMGDTDPNTMSFMNRLNLKSKLRDLIDVSFTDEERPYVDMAMTVETWDDVINACRAIYEYLKEKNEQKELQQQTQEFSNGEGSDGSGFQEGQSTQEGPADGSNPSKSADESSSLDSSESNGNQAEMDSMEDQSSDKKTGKDAKENQVKGSGGGNDSNEDFFNTSTDDAYRANEEKLIEKTSYGTTLAVVNGVKRDQLKEMIMPYDKLSAARKEWIEAMPKEYLADIEYDTFGQKYKEFVDESNKLVNVMAKEFEMRKAAYQYSRAKTARSGSLDVNRLHEYKFSDDIFRKVTKLADAKSHGMVMLIDFSSSMSNVIGDVIRQTLSLAMFCKKVGIPFDVYTYTAASVFSKIKVSDFSFSLGDVNHSDIRMLHLLSSSFSRSDYNEACRWLFNLSVSAVARSVLSVRYVESMGRTPTIEVLSAMPHIFTDFKNKYGVQKIVFTFLTDGEPSIVESVREGYNNQLVSSAMSYNGRFVMNVDGSYIKASGTNSMAAEIGNHFRKMGIINVGYFLSTSVQQTKHAIGRAAKTWDKQIFKEAAKSQRENRFVSFDNTLGYDRYFIIRSTYDNLTTDVQEFDVKQGARKGEIARAFKKYASSKKISRIFATQFAEIIS